MKLKEIYNKLNHQIPLSKELGILVDFELFFAKESQKDVAFVFDDDDFSQLMKALNELDISSKDIIVNSYNLLDEKDKFYSESILIHTTKKIEEIEAVFRKYRSVEPYSVDDFSQDEEYLTSEVIWWFRADGTVIDYKGNPGFADHVICLYFE